MNKNKKQSIKDKILGFKDIYKPKEPVDSLRRINGEHALKLSTKFNLLVWNIYKSKYGDSFYKALKPLVDHHDILILQEVVGMDAFLNQVDLSNLHLTQCISYERHSGVAESLVTGVKGEFVGSAVRLTSLGTEPIVKTPKSSLITRVEIEGKAHPLIVVNLHLLLIKTLKGHEAEVRQVASKLKDFHGPAIIAGDFNTYLPGHLKRTDAILEPYGFQRVPLKTSFKEMNLDHIYFRGLRYSHEKILRDVRASDHYPLSITFEIE